jgi:hypothetical protein
VKAIALLALLSLSACAETPAAQCPVAERGAWTVVSPAEGRPGLETADICDEQVTDALNYVACEDRARAFNAELAESGEAPIYFVMWSEE